MRVTVKYFLRALGLVGLLGAAGCNPTQIEPVTDPNNQSIEAVVANATIAQMQALGVGLEASYRLGHTNNAPYNQITGVFGREILILASNDPRWTGEIIQGNGGTVAVPLDPTSFYTNGSYNAIARTIRAANVVRQSAAGSVQTSDPERQGYYAFADTYEALAKLHLLNLMGENGIRTDVANFQKPGKFTAGSAPALADIRQLLDRGAAGLAKAGSSFPFPLSGGFAGFNTPNTFLRFNRALAARVALYQKDYAGALTALSGSFYDPAGSLTLGPKITFAPGVGGDQGNSYFQVPNTRPSTYVGVPSQFVTEAEAGDRRLGKVAARTTPVTQAGLSSSYDPLVYPAQNTPYAIIRNEELILIAAEAKANSNNVAGALADINAIRTRSGGLTAYAGATDAASLTNEILRQRRYSLFYEGHWWVDLRRLGKLSPNPTPQISLPAATAPYKLFDRLPIPDAEVRWDQANP